MSIGTAMRSTSSGISTITSPFRLNITTMVKSKAMSVMGEIMGMKRVSYQSVPNFLARICRLRKPAANGIPR